MICDRPLGVTVFLHGLGNLLVPLARVLVYTLGK